MSEPREKIQWAIAEVRREITAARDAGLKLDANDEAGEILARCAEALLKEHAADENSACCVVSSHVHTDCPVLLEIVKPAKEEA